ncbi:MAG: sugar phosphate isomerase/epimerase family protein [Candidatus Methylomirabilales bacterium]
MRDYLQSYMQVGIVHFMAYPQCMKGEGPIYDTLTKIVEDDFFSAVEITWIKDPAERQRVKALLATSHMTVGYGAQPCLLSQKLNLNHFDPAERKKAVDQVKACTDEAAEVGAKAIAVLSGVDPGERRDEAMKLLIDSLHELAGYAKERGLRFILESFDAKYDKKCLIGPHKDALAVCRALRKDFPDFGIMVDLSHLPIQDESPKKALGTLKKANIAHIHIGNSVKQQGHPAYGDQHPRFGLPGGENDVPQLVDFLKALFEIEYLAKGRRPVVGFEVKPLPGETSEAVIASAKRTLLEAWARA